jgi:hypothetical protein
MHSSGHQSGSFQSDATARDIHSRSHWAVQESVERQRYQGDLFDLVLPVLDLPGASVTSTARTNQDSDTLKAGQTASEGSQDPASIKPTADRLRVSPEDEGHSSGAVNIVLCGTNRTTNIFLREIIQDPRFDVYKLPPPTSVDSSDKPPVKGRSKSDGKAVRTSSRSSTPVLGKEAYYTVGVYAMGEQQGIKRLVAKIKVFGRGQQGNLERVSPFCSEGCGM